MSGVLRIILILIISYITTVTLSYIYYFARIMWHWHNVKKAGDAFQKCIDDFFSSLPPIGNELCRDCKYSVFSKNNSNLVCLNGNSRNFGTTLAPDTDMLGYCYFERKDNDLDGAEENKGEKLCRISQ